MQPKDVDEVLLNALLDTCCRLKDLNRLEATVQRMRDLKITPSPVTLGILVKTYGQAGDIQKVLAVWDEMVQQRGQANAVTYGCMIDACVKCSRLDKAVEIFAGMRESGKHRNTILYTTLIKGYGLDNDLKSALELFQEMAVENVPYNTITYNSIIDACVKGGDLAMAEGLLHQIIAPTSALEPDLITFSTLLKGYCHSGDLDKALQLAECIKQRGLRCDELVYNTLMDGCVKANDVTAGVGLFEEMVNCGMRPSAITHSILTRLYQRAGYEEDAAEAVAQLYQHHGIERPTGGDRNKGMGGKRNQRSPLGNGRMSPNSSPAHSFGNSANTWCENGYENYVNQSAASTPHGSPQHSMGQNNGLFLPMDAMRGMPPPFPGMGGSDTPYSSCQSMASGYGGSLCGSPCMSPTGMDQQQGQGFLLSPGQVQQQNGMVAAPSLPPFPFSGNSAPSYDASQRMDAPSPQHCYQGQMSQSPHGGMSGMAPAMGTVPCNMMMQSSSGCASPTGFAPAGPSLAWQGQAMSNQQSPFPMPLSAPQGSYDLPQCAPSQPQPQQAYFEFMQDGGQAGGQGQNGSQQGQSPFCL